MSIVDGVLIPFTQSDFFAKANDFLRNRSDPKFIQWDATELDMYTSVGWATPSKRYREVEQYLHAALVNGDLSPVREHTFEKPVELWQLEQIMRVTAYNNSSISVDTRPIVGYSDHYAVRMMRVRNPWLAHKFKLQPKIDFECSFLLNDVEKIYWNGERLRIEFQFQCVQVAKDRLQTGSLEDTWLIRDLAT